LIQRPLRFGHKSCISSCALVASAVWLMPQVHLNNGVAEAVPASREEREAEVAQLKQQSNIQDAQTNS